MAGLVGCVDISISGGKAMTSIGLTCFESGNAWSSGAEVAGATHIAIIHWTA